MRAELTTALMSFYYSNSFSCIRSFLGSPEVSCSMEPELLMVQPHRYRYHCNACAMPKVSWIATDFTHSRVLSRFYFRENAICQNLREVASEFSPVGRHMF
jgi:hypothetical protein